MARNPQIMHFVYVPFSGVGILGYRGDEWFKDRIEVFKKYTLKSLQKQTNPHFVIWLSFRPEEEGHRYIHELEMYMVARGVRYHITYNGLLYWDDKFDTRFIPRVINILRVLRRCWRLNLWKELVPSLRDLFNDKNSTLYQRLAKSLNSFPPEYRFPPLVYMTRLDSDDMLRHDVIETIQNTRPESNAFTFNRGLIYNTTTGELAEWCPDTNPPFHTIIFKSETFFDPELHLAHYQDFKSHEDIPRIFGGTFLPDYMYCVTTHNPKNHISTTWNHPFRGAIMGSKLLQNFI